MWNALNLELTSILEFKCTHRCW